LRDQIILLHGVKEKRNQLQRFDTDRQTTFVHVTRKLCYEQPEEVLIAKLMSLLYIAKMTLTEQRSCCSKTAVPSVQEVFQPPLGDSSLSQTLVDLPHGL